jgi:hypothetical protein
MNRVRIVGQIGYRFNERTEFVTMNDLAKTTVLEKLADCQHEIWSHWMKYLFSVSTENEDGSVTLPAEKVNRWQRQMNTKYANLSPKEQRSDLEQAMKIMDVISRKQPDTDKLC